MATLMKVYRKLFILGLAGICAVMAWGTADACRMYGVVSNNLPDGLLQEDLIDAPNSLKNLAISGNVDGWGIASYPYYLVDPGFNDSADSADLRANGGSGQDWYESRNDNPALLTLNETDVGGNSSKKAALLNYGNATNAYLTQEFGSAQTGSFSVSFDIYIDRIEDSGTYDRSGTFYIGDDSATTNAPTGTSNERFVFMAFYDGTPGDTGSDIEIRCRTSSAQAYGTTSAWTQVATGLSYDTWHTIQVILDVAAGTYDVYVDDVLRGDNIAKYNGFVSASLTHLSFVSDSDGRGDFYVDNVRDTIERGAERAYTDTSYDTVVGYLNALEPKVTLAHVRNCVSGCCEHNMETIADPHPFYRYKNGKRWTFVHNGTVSIPLLESLIGPAYLSANPPNGSDIQDCITDVVDSELYFLYVLKEIEEAGWNTTNGIVAAVNELIDNGEAGMNFILSDGDTIWGFRRQDLASHTLYYLDGSLEGYSAVASQYPSSTQGSWQVINNDELVMLTADAAPVVIDVQNPGCLTDEDCDDGLFCNGAETCAGGACVPGTNPCIPPLECDEGTDTCYTPSNDILADPQFSDSIDSADLRANGSGQDWYESRNDNPALLTLNEADVGGNSTKKAALLNYGIANNAYLTQEFSSAQTGTFSVSFEIYIDRIQDNGTYDRSGIFYIGDDSVSANSPNNTSNERFVFMSFYDATPGDTGSDIEIRCRTSSAQAYGTSSAWTQVATGLSYDTWHTIRLDVDVAVGTYDVSVDDVLAGDNIPKYNGFVSSSVTHVSFVADSDGRGDFYVDNVYSPPPEEPECETAADCDDTNLCTDDDCVAGSCVNTNNIAPCDDGNACTENDICAAGSCQAGIPIICNDGNECTDDSCNPASGCVYANNTAPCDDGLFCTATDICADGICLGSGDPCTPPLICDEAADACLGCVNDADCDDGNVCTDDTCAAGTCVNDNNSDPCDDGSVCTENDTCTAGSCQGTPITCNDGNVCTNDSCDPASGCEYVNNTAPCDDGLFCNGSDTCAGGSCSDHAGDPCTPPDVCDEGSDTCIDLGEALLTDIEFEDSVDSADLRANGSGQDWYESRNDVPTLLTLNEADVGGNSSKKAALLNYGIANNAYLSQEFGSAQTGSFSVSFDIYIDRIEDNGTYDRSGIFYIGDDRITTNAPTGTSDERLVFMSFYDATPGDTGDDIEIRCRTSSSQAYGTTSAWTQVATGLSYDTWHTVKILLDVAAGTYDVYVDDVLTGYAVPKYSGYVAASVTHISFVADSDGRGDFYVDNAEALSSSVTADFSADVTTGDAPLSVQFTDLSTGAIDTWSWDFNNDGTEDSSDQNPAYIYTMPGNYTVSLVVSGAGGTDTETRVSYISVTGGPEPALHVSPTLLDFGAALDTLTLQIMNRGNEPFDWEAASGEAWISTIDPGQSGTPLQPGESVTVSVTIDRDSFGLLGGSEHNCRMWGAISDDTVPGSAITYDLITAPVSLKSLTSATSNNDGWSMAYYLDFGDDPVIQRGAEYASHSTAYDNAVNAMASLPSKKVTLAHVRNCTSGCCDNGNETINDPHPFYRVKNGTTWLFQHNGDINKTVLTNAIGADYLAANPPNGSAIPQCDPSDPNLVVDSELYFLLLLKNIEANNWSVEQGILETFPSIQSYAANFIMSDGYTLWALRRGHDLAYFYDEASEYAAVASQPSNPADDRWTVLPDNTLVILRPGEAPQIITIADFSSNITGIIRITTSLGEAVDVLVAAQELPAEPTFISFAPESGTSIVGTPRAFTLEIGDGDGYEDLSSVRFVIKEGTGTGTTSDAIILEYRSAAPTRIYLYDQAASGWIWATLGSATILENGLCAIDALQTSVTGSGTMLTLNLSITPKTAFIADPLSEDKRIWLRVSDTDNNTLGDLEIGTWSISALTECLNDDDCDDGAFCNGDEICAAGDCQPGTYPCEFCDAIGCVCDEIINYCTGCDSDDDCDGICAPGDSAPDCSGSDNCSAIPNGDLLGTCVSTRTNITLSYWTGNPLHHIICTSDADCISSGGICQLEQGDCNDNGVGDVCECYADCNGDTTVNLTDLVIMKVEYFRTDCDINSCQADCNGDDQVNLSDLIIMKIQYFRTDCPVIP